MRPPTMRTRTILGALICVSFVAGTATAAVRTFGKPRSRRIDTGVGHAAPIPAAEPGPSSPPAPSPQPAASPAPSPEPVPSPTPAAPRPSPRPAAVRIDQGLYVMGIDGSGLRLVAEAAYLPSWSPDGRRLAYVAAPSGEIRVHDLAGGSVRTVATGFGNHHSHLAWSPDSLSIAYSGLGPVPGGRDILIADATGATPPRLIPADGDDANVDWSSKGVIASSSELGLFAFAADGSGRTRISPKAFSFGDLRWSPDGTMVVVLPDSSAEDVLVDADGGNPRQVGGGAAAGSDAGLLSWSSSNREMVVNGTLNGQSGLFIAPSDGTAGRWLAGGLSEPPWSPAGDWIAAFEVGASGRRTRIVLGSPDGASRRTLVDLPTTHALTAPLDWSPDGRSIVFVAHRNTR